MKKRMLLLGLTISLAMVFGYASLVNGAVIFSEDFNDLENETAITTSNTDWNHVRTGTGTGDGPIEAKKPSSFDATASMVLGASSGGSITVVSAYDLDMDPETSDTLGTVFTLSFDVCFTGDTGDCYAFIGDGTVYSGNSGFSYVTTLVGIKWDLPETGSTITLQNCDTDWHNQDPLGNFDFEIGTTYRVAIVGNMSGSTVDYTAGTVANDTYDLWVDNILRLDDVTVNTDQSLSGMDSFRFYGINGASADLELDDVELLNQGDETLPVILSTFTATFLNNVPTLYWKTESETDNLGWYVYRNTENDFTNAKEISNLISGYGTTSEQHSYIYEDPDFIWENAQPGDTYWYWLESRPWWNDSSL